MSITSRSSPDQVHVSGFLFPLHNALANNIGVVIEVHKIVHGHNAQAAKCFSSVPWGIPSRAMKSAAFMRRLTAAWATKLAAFLSPKPSISAKIFPRIRYTGRGLYAVYRHCTGLPVCAWQSGSFRPAVPSTEWTGGTRARQFVFGQLMLTPAFDKRAGAGWTAFRPERRILEISRTAVGANIFPDIGNNIIGPLHKQGCPQQPISIG